jgi:hypothetical protein
MSLNRCGAALAAKSWQTRRKSARVFSSTCERNASRQFSECQNLRNIGLVESTRLQIEVFERNAGDKRRLAGTLRMRFPSGREAALKFLHALPVSDGLLGISPNSSDRDGWLSMLALLPLLSPEPARRSEGRESRLIFAKDHRSVRNSTGRCTWTNSGLSEEWRSGGRNNSGDLRWVRHRAAMILFTHCQVRRLDGPRKHA